MPHRLSRPALLALLIILSPCLQVWAASPIDPVLQATQAPPGVVFEIATGRADSLSWALPLVKHYIRQIHQRFPDTTIAVVSHGREMFSLQKHAQETATTPLQQLSQQLVKEGVSLHVCGTYAARKGLSAEDFPEYVNVAAAGPTQIKDYIAVGYIHIKIQKPDSVFPH